MKNATLLCLLLLFAATNLLAQSKPFPQNVNYPHGFQPTNYDQYIAGGTNYLNSGDAANMYADWVDKYYASLSNNRARIRWDGGGNWNIDGNDLDYTASEGMGYGMILTAYMGDKDKFDRLLNFYNWAIDKKVNRQGGSRTDYLMPWLVNAQAVPCDGTNACTNSGGAGGNGPATDGDIDAAFALLVAHEQWGSQSYVDRAKEIVGLLKSDYFETCSSADGTWVMKPGDFGGCGGNLHDVSYYAPGYFRLFADLMNDSDWDDIANNTFYHLWKTPGLLAPDWQTPAGGSASGWIYNYEYDASRIPWRIALDYVWNGVIGNMDGGYSWLTQVGDFAAGKGANNIVNGYYKNGNDKGNWTGSATFAGGFAVGMMASNQSRVNSFSKRLSDIYYGVCPWDANNNNPCNMGYFDLSTATLYAFAITGNYWEPTSFSGASGSTNHTIKVRARGINGSEKIRLKVGGTTIATWNLSTNYQTFTKTTTASGGIDVEYFNDANGRDARINWIQVDGTTRQAENQSFNSGVWQGGSCGGSFSEMLHCNGIIGFGNVNARSAQLEVAPQQLRLYPNPCNEEYLSLEGIEVGEYEFNIFNPSGQLIQSNMLNYDGGPGKLRVADLAAGVYFIHLRGNASSYQSKFVKL